MSHSPVIWLRCGRCCSFSLSLCLSQNCSEQNRVHNQCGVHCLSFLSHSEHRSPSFGPRAAPLLFQLPLGFAHIPRVATDFLLLWNHKLPAWISWMREKIPLAFRFIGRRSITHAWNSSKASSMLRTAVDNEHSLKRLRYGFWRNPRAAFVDRATTLTYLAE